ncbi:unnamed protein product, partial [marine sediment metagenome]
GSTESSVLPYQFTVLNLRAIPSHLTLAIFMNADRVEAILSLIIGVAAQLVVHLVYCHYVEPRPLHECEKGDEE